MGKQIDPEKTLQMVEPDLVRFEQLSEKEFDADLVKNELEKLSKEELLDLQVSMFAQYHKMAKAIVELGEALRVVLQSEEPAAD